jgi:hypothetical protein
VPKLKEMRKKRENRCFDKRFARTTAVDFSAQLFARQICRLIGILEQICKRR